MILHLKRGYLYLIIFQLFVMNTVCAQNNTVLLTFEQLIEIARNNSPQSLIARHSFRSAYWQNRSFKANFLPSLQLRTNPISINRSIISNIDNDGINSYIESKSNSSEMELNISQKVPFTGGEFMMGSSISRILNDSDTAQKFLINPINISYRQPLFTFNPYKWERKIEPLRYKESKLQYQSKLEEISQQAVQRFFDLMLAQINTDIARINLQNNDTLYKIAQGRYNIGTIARDELLQMELTYLNSKNTYDQSLNDLKDSHFRLRSFLGFPNTKQLLIVVPDSVPGVTIDPTKALEYALQNNPKIVSIKRNTIEADRDVAKTRSEKLINADLYVSFGLSKSDYSLENITSDLGDQQMVSVGISIPIVDWGRGKGQYKMALSNRELTKIMIEQEQLDFEQEIYLKILRFNMQKDQIIISAKADTISELRYNIAKQRFMVGNVAITDLNIAGNERDGARRNYVTYIRDYWMSYFAIRALTGFDFLINSPIETDINSLIE